jgi:hypothetical protein
MSRKDVFGIEVEVGDIVFSAPNHKYSSKPEVGKVCGVFDSGRVTIKVPASKAVYAYQEGAPEVEVESTRWVTDDSAEPDRWGRKPYKQEPYTYKSKDYTVVRRVPYWLKKQAADITLVVLRKNGQEGKSLEELLNLSEMRKALNMNYEADAPELD